MKYKISRVDILLLLLLFSVTFFVLLSFYTNHDIEESYVVTPTPTPSTTPSPSPLPSPLPTPSPTPVPEDPPIAEKILVSRGSEYHVRVTKDMLSNPMDMVASAYDLSYASCKKERSHPEYGITRSGARAKEFHTVAVDPKVIPLGSILYIEFPEAYASRNGVYVAEDIGSAIKGNRIDVFFGEDKVGETTVHEECYKFGKRDVTVYLIKGSDDD